MVNHHILLVAYPAKGHLNPALRFAKRLTETGIEVTLATSLYALHSLYKSSDIPKGLNFAAISDGYGDSLKPKGFDIDHLNALSEHGSYALRGAIHASGDNGRPIMFVVYTILLTWAAEVAREFHIPSSLLWIQSATVLGIYYHYFHGYQDDIDNNGRNPSWSIQLPGLPSLSSRELPSFILPSSSITNNLAIAMFKQQFEILDADKKSIVLINTFDTLEPQALKAVEKYNLIPIGPLVSSPLWESSFSDDYMRWLSSKPAASVVYISFGSLMTPSRPQMEEIARALLQSGRPFLWVIREMENKEKDKDEGQLSFLKGLEEKGMIVPWCSQLHVLRQPSLGCFITHCGWNSTLESVVFGVPLIAFPEWTDQVTNAKLIKDVWKTGVKVTTNENGVVESSEIKKCIELVMDGGEEGLELRRNAQKWRILAREAFEDGGSSDKNFISFLA